MRRVVGTLLVVVAALAVTACNGAVDVHIDVAEDGSGTVTVTASLDAAAAEALGDPDAAIAADDLVAAGWTLEPAVVADDGSLTIVGRRDFASPSDLVTVMNEIGGVDGVFRDVSLGVDDGFGSTAYELSMTVALTGSFDQFSDPELAAALGGLPLGRTPEELAAGGLDANDVATLRVRVDLPGTTRSAENDADNSDPTAGRVDDDAVEWEFPLNGGEPVDATIAAASSVSSSTSTLLIVAGVLGAAAIAALVAALVVRARR